MAPTMDESGSPFESIESAHEYTRLLIETIEESRKEITADTAATQADGQARLQQALRLVSFKLDKLKGHLEASHRLLNDLRTLRRLLLDERGAADPQATAAADSDPDWSKG